MKRIKACYRNQKLELEAPLDFADGTVLEVEVRVPEHAEPPDELAWELALSRLETEWGDDSLSQDWREPCGAEAW